MLSSFMTSRDLKAALLDEKEKWKQRLKIDLLVTRRCNFRCQHCLITRYVGDIDFQLVASLASELRQLGVDRTNLNGGEVALHPGFLDIVHCLKDNGISCNTITNGTLVSPNSVKMLKTLGVSVGVSLDGPAEFHNSFRRSPDAFACAVQAVQLALEHDVQVSIVSSIARKNLCHIDWLVDFCLKKGVTVLRIQPVYAYGNARELHEKGELLSQDDFAFFYSHLMEIGAQTAGRLAIYAHGDFRSDIKHHPCKFGLCFGKRCHSNSHPWPRSVTVTPKGEVIPLTSYVLETISIGNVRDGFESVIDGYYASDSHMALLRCLEKAYIEEIDASDSEYVDMSLVLTKRLAEQVGDPSVGN